MSGNRLVGKRVAVTGAAGGLGRAFVVELASQGARVLALDVREDELAETCALAGAATHPLVADVTSARALAEAAAAAGELLGGLDGLVNNAAVVAGLTRRPLTAIPVDEWDRVLAVNVKGTWLATSAFLPLLEDAGGAVVNLASETAYTGSPGLAHYVASKGAVLALTRAFARELGPAGVRVNAIAPGFIPTEAAAEMRGGPSYDTAATPLGRVGEPDDLLGTLVFLLSDDSAFVTGQCLLVNGGRVFG